MPASASALQIRIVESDADFAALSQDWEALQSGAAATSVFVTFDWQYLWWRTYGKGRPLRLILATSDGALVGILPLYIDTLMILSAPVRLLRLVGVAGDTSPDDLGPVLAKGREAEIARGLADAVLQMTGWDVLLLADLQPDNAFAAAMRAAAESARLSIKGGRSEQIAYVDLPASFEGWLASLHRDRRYRIRNIRKKLNAAHPTRFFVWNDPATLDEGFATLTRLHLKRWENRSQSFSSPEYLAFHHAVMAACLQRDRLRLYCLELSGTIVAMFYFYRFRDHVYLMQGGFDPDYARFKPGQVLLGYIVEHAIGEGNKVLDFLRGNHRYKDELATGERETIYLNVFRPTLAAYAYRARKIHLPALRRRLEGIRERWRRSAAATGVDAQD